MDRLSKIPLSIFIVTLITKEEGLHSLIRLSTSPKMMLNGWLLRYFPFSSRTAGHVHHFFFWLVISPQPGRKAWSARTWMSSPHANMQMAGSLAKGRGNISEDLSVIRAGQCVSRNVIPHKRPSNKSKKRENRMQNEEKRNAGWSACAFWSWRSWPSPIVLLRRWTGRGSPSYFKELTEIIELHSPNVVEIDLQMTKQVIETDLIWICK